MSVAGHVLQEPGGKWRRAGAANQHAGRMAWPTTSSRKEKTHLADPKSPESSHYELSAWFGLWLYQAARSNLPTILLALHVSSLARIQLLDPVSTPLCDAQTCFQPCKGICCKERRSASWNIIRRRRGQPGLLSEPALRRRYACSGLRYEPNCCSRCQAPADDCHDIHTPITLHSDQRQAPDAQPPVWRRFRPGTCNSISTNPV